jgi:two-component system response regulator
VTDDTILFVEDNPDDVVLTLRAFERNKIANEVVVVSDGAVALDYLFGTGTYEGRDPADTPVLVLLDLKLPKVDGHEVLRRIREHEATRLLPVVILTSSKENSDLVRCYSLGANGYVRKPIDSAEFMDVVRRLGVYWLLVNEAPPKPNRGVGRD